MKKFAVLIPSDVKIEKIVSLNSELKPDYIKYALNSIVVQQGMMIENEEFYKDEPEKYKLGSNIFKRYVKIDAVDKAGSQSYKLKDVLDFLCQDNIEVMRSRSTTKMVSILNKEGYIVGEKSYTYRLDRHFRGNHVKVDFIDDIKIINKIRKTNSYTDTVLDRGDYEFLSKFFDTQKLHINLEEATKFCESRYKNHKEYGKYIKEFVQILNLYNGIFRLRYKEDSIGRIYTNISLLPKVYRRFVSYDGKSLSEVDLSNSVIFFLGLLLDKSIIERTIERISNNKYKSINSILEKRKLSTLLMFSKFVENLAHKEVEQVQELGRNGEFYDFFVPEFDKIFSFEKMKEYYEKENEDEYIATEKQKRKVSKKQIVAMLFAKSTHYLEIQEIFKIKFPELLERINRFKNRVGYKKFSYLLFQIEAYFILNIAARNFNKQYYKKAPVFTLHDCLITISEYVEELQQSLNKSFMEFLDYAPKTETKDW